MQTTTQLTTTELGSTGLEITPMGFGARAIGGGNICDQKVAELAVAA